jgi:hypothetical protein
MMVALVRQDLKALKEMMELWVRQDRRVRRGRVDLKDQQVRQVLMVVGAK